MLNPLNGILAPPQVGSIISTINTNNVDGYLELNGATISKQHYSELLAVLREHTAYQINEEGDPLNETESSYDLPDWSGCFLRAHGDLSETIGEVQGDAIRNIVGVKGDIVLRYERNSAESGAFHTVSIRNYSYGGSGPHPNVHLGFDASRVVPTADENRPVNVAVRYFIKY